MKNMFLFLKSLSRSVHDEQRQLQPELSKTQGGDDAGGTDDLCTSLTVWRKSLLVSCNGFTVIDSNGNLVYRVDNYMRSVHDEQRQLQPELSKTQGGDDAGGTDDLCTSLTVWRKSLLVSCNGFTVIDSNGNLVYRVDNYMGGRPKELVLMDGKGNSILTMKRCKNLGLIDAWVLYGGEVGDYCTSEKPIFYVKKCINILHTNKYSCSTVLAYVYRRSDKRCTYTIEGSYSHRSCKVKRCNNRRYFVRPRCFYVGYKGRV